ncbi:hypothetical protein METBIDRAFT_76114 [Metschnikowia bicuspidata var. bicuspidata NRRL YB-4993]|uniref:LuxS/MPP-like metallohydrolase n=1 Tax=Metschnikowia bicuspidata var. bicuspidata NRRL YB-4993 TaxID=869754 RepID=A0A1A0HGJ9_9ASCO|nr:hypothetical protein METBIDRAFT_76114 [Metschnikowia bicuspidata var. bicuspidata NRRL YB-4993]OBA22978.1 hypothetical protein METBIDRAFT_76114 [Metschnikowia bicuspidata var. bicuspidata NRRL YB-4993]
MLSAYTVLAEDSAIEKPVLDDRKYRFLKLAQNDLHVLVIHDPTTDKSAASLDVNVGSFADKKYTILGLAHFCEHLLFMGTEKYPEENEYASYLSKHSGHSNAYTAAEHTNYYFEVGSAHLEGALDRFAQFFISPLFSKSCKDREIRAVDSENKKNLQNDLWRMYQLEKLTSNPKHPFNGFSTGNYATLNDEPESRGLNVRDVLLQFYKEQYSANLMSLVILGSESLDELTAWAADKFAAIPNASLPRPSYDNELIYAPEQMGKLLKAKSIMDTNKLELSFMVPDDMEKHWETKPGQYYSHLLGHESKGSLCYYLKEKNWITSLSAGNMKVCQGNSLFMVEAELTPQGLEQWQDIVVHAFEYLKLLHSQDPEEWIWKEVSDMSEINFRFKQKLSTSSTVSRMSNSLYKFVGDAPIPPESLLNYTIMKDFNAAKIKKYGSYLVPSNVRLSLTSQLFEGLPSKEKWYGSEYSLEDIPRDLSNTIQNVSLNPKFHMTAPNNFIPKDFSVLGKKADRPLSHPHLISDTHRHETWFKQDDSFEVPKGYINLTILTPALGESIQSTVLGTLWTELLDDELNDLKYYAELVGLHCSIYQSRSSITLKVGGYNDKLPEFLKQISQFLISFTPKSDRFESIRYKHAQQLKNFGYSTPYSQVGARFLQLFNEKTYTVEERLAITKEVKFEDLEKFALDLLWSKGVFVQTLIHGNFDYSKAREVHGSIELLFKEMPSIDTDKDIVRKTIKAQSHRLAKNENARYDIELGDPNNVNSCIEYYVQVGKLGNQDAKLRVLTDLLGVMVYEPCFNQLRTKEQLGYVVFSGYRQNRSDFGFRILIQSERLCDYLEYRIVEFFKKFAAKNLGPELTDEAFDKFKSALKTKKLAKLKNLHEECSRFWNAISDGYYDFEQKQNDVKILEGITKKEFLSFFDQYFGYSESNSKPILSVYLKSQKVPSFDGAKAVSAAVFNFIYGQDWDVSSDVVDKILSENDGDTPKAIEEIVAAVQQQTQGSNLDWDVIQKRFLEQVLERAALPTPAAYPLGQPVQSESEFKAAHEKGEMPGPVKDLTSFYYPQDGAHL